MSENKPEEFDEQFLERLRNDPQLLAEYRNRAQNVQQPVPIAQTAHEANELCKIQISSSYILLRCFSRRLYHAEVNQTLANQSAEWKLRCKQKAREKAQMEKEAMAAKIEKLKLEAETSKLAMEAKMLQDSIAQNYADAQQRHQVFITFSENCVKIV